MTDEITETIEGPDEAEILAFPDRAKQEEEPSYHSILQVWDTILDGAAEFAKNARISPQWANQMVMTYNGLTYADARRLHELYFGRTETLRQILLEAIKANEGCFKVFTAEEDRETNSAVYKQLLVDWQLQITRWEIAWDCESPTAAIEVACFGEMHKAFFGQTGLTQYLDNIQLEYTEDDQASLAEQLAALKAGDRE